MYKIKMLCYDPPYDKQPYFDEVSKSFQYTTEANISLLECAIDEAEENKGFIVTRNFEHDGVKYDAAVVIAAEGGYQPVTCYKIEWVNENKVDEYNSKLRKEYGEDLTLWIHSCEEEDDDDGNERERYYFSGATISESDHYDTLEEAYEDACDYLDDLLG